MMRQGWPVCVSVRWHYPGARIIRNPPARDGSWIPDAQAIEAQRAETVKQDSVEDESAVPKGCAQNDDAFIGDK